MSRDNKIGRGTHHLKPYCTDQPFILHRCSYAAAVRANKNRDTLRVDKVEQSSQGMDLKPRVSLSGEELGSLLSAASSGSVPIRAPLTLEEEEEEEEGSDSNSEPDIPRVKLSYSNGASSSSSETSETASERAFAADAVEETGQISGGSPKDWTFRPFVASPSGNHDDREDVPLMFEERPCRASPAIPIARVSMEFDDDDDDELRVIEEIEEEEFVVRVPGFVVEHEEGPAGEGNESRLMVKSQGDDRKWSEVLEVNVGEDFSVTDATSSSASAGETSEGNGAIDGIGIGEGESSVGTKPCSEDRNQVELLEVKACEDLLMEDTIESCVSGDGISGSSALLGENTVEGLSSEDAVESSQNEAGLESLRVMEVESSGLRDLENMEAGVDSFDIADCVVSTTGSEQEQETENEQGLNSDLEPETTIHDGVKLVDVLEDASVSWVPSLAADIEKIAACEGSSDRCECDGDGDGKQLLHSGSEGNLVTEGRRNLEKIELLRQKFLRLLSILGCCLQDKIVAHVLGGESSNPLLGLGVTNETGIQLESDLSLNIVVLGKLGVGKSSTINSILGELRAPVDPFHTATPSIEEIMGSVCGIRFRILDTPGLGVSQSEQSLNRKMLSSVRKYTSKFPPDIFLYVDRLDNPARDFNDLPVLQTITHALGSSVWERAILALTHADGQLGSPSSYEAFVGQRLDLIWSCIARVGGRNWTPPVSLVENSCGQEVLPNGERWRVQLLLLCCSMKVMAGASSGSQPRDSIRPRELLGIREDDQEKEAYGSRQGSTEEIYVPGDSRILDVLGGHEPNLLDLKIQNLGEEIASHLDGQTRPLKSLRISADEDEDVDMGIKEHERTTLADGPLSFDLREVGGDSAIRASVQSQFSVGKSRSKLEVHIGFRDRQRWKITLRMSSCHGVPVSIISLLPIAGYIFQFLFPGRCSGALST